MWLVGEGVESCEVQEVAGGKSHRASQATMMGWGLLTCKRKSLGGYKPGGSAY